MLGSQRVQLSFSAGNGSAEVQSAHVNDLSLLRNRVPLTTSMQNRPAFDSLFSA